MRLLFGNCVGLLFFSVLLPAFAQVPQVSIDQTNGTGRVGINGTIGQYYFLQVSTNLSEWGTQVVLPLTNNPQRWIDAESAICGRRFYRAVKPVSAPAPFYVPDFRLTDHLGKSRLFSWHTNRIIVLIFTGNGCTNVQNLVQTIKSLRDQFTPRGVLFQMVDANDADTRSNIVAEANAYGIDLPILHDDSQIVAREFNATTTPEAVAIDMATWAIFYRGAIDDRVAATTNSLTQNYLSDALSQFLTGRTVSPTETLPKGCSLQYRPLFSSISYSTNIAPLLQNKCVRCHSPGNIAPWAMTNYNIVAQFAQSIKGEVLAGRMPPWHADSSYLRCTNDFSLTPLEKAMLVQWVNEGAPRGTGSDPLTNLPPQTNYPFAWPADLGTPTRIYTIPTQSIPATGTLNYRYILITNTFTSNVWLRAAVVKPGNTRVVHHCLVTQGIGGSGIDGFFAGYVPGADPAAYPTNTGKFLPAGQILQFQMHYVTDGTNETDATQLGLYVMSPPPAYQYNTKSVYTTSFSIPPNNPEYQVSATNTLAKNTRLFGFSPHMHLRGYRFRYDAVYTNGVRETLFSVPNYDFAWQTSYRLAQAKDLPAGTKLECIGAFDNSAQNPANPNPAATVTFGEQTTDEMFIGYYDYIEP